MSFSKQNENMINMYIDDTFDQNKVHMHKENQEASEIMTFDNQGKSLNNLTLLSDTYNAAENIQTSFQHCSV